MVRRFELINENGETFSLMDLDNKCLLIDPDGLGMSYSTSYERVGNSFQENLRQLEQGKISGTAVFSSYKNYKDLIDYLERSEKLRIHYVVPDVAEYYRDVLINEISKSEIKQNGFMEETITFECISLWYSINEANYIIKANEDEIRWDFKWDSRFISYSMRNLNIVNNGHTEAAIQLTIDGEVVNPEIALSVEGEEVQTIPFTCTINEFEKFMYSSKDGDSYVKKQKTDGTYESLFNLTVLDFDNNNVLKLPKGKSCELSITADDDIASATLQVFIYFKSV